MTPPAPVLGPPATEAELCARAQTLAGRTLGELGAELGQDVPDTAKRAKGLVGQMLERALGATAASRSAPDFEALGVELKTVPVGPNGRPRETTFVCTIPLEQMESTDFERSAVWRKLARVLWIPIEADPKLPLPARRIGAAVLWSPDPGERAALQRDWERVAALIADGEVDGITAHLGDVLQVRPKAAHSKVRRRAPSEDGAIGWSLPRGFYLRTSFTHAILRAAMARGS